MDKFLQKLTSRKFWVAVSSIVTGIVLLFGADEGLAEQISGAVMVLGGAIGYMIAEGLIDAAHAAEAAGAAVEIAEGIAKIDE